MPVDNPLYDAFLRPVTTLERVFLDRPGRGPLSFAETAATAHRVASRLARCGVNPGDRVAVQVEKSSEAICLYLGCVARGAVFLPLNTAYTPAELEYFIDNAEPALVVSDPARRDAVAGVAGAARVETLGPAGEGSLFAEIAAEPSDAAPTPRRGDDLAAILYTSGTTGRSKGAMLTQDNLLSNARALAEIWRFSEADALLHALPIFHTHGLFVATNICLTTRASMIFLPKFDLDAVFDALPQATTMMGVPTFYTRLLDDARLTRAVTAHMRLFVSGSAPLLAATHEAFEARTGHKVLERYGMTETNMITSNPYDGERVAGTVGMALPGVELRIAEPSSGAALPNGEVGVIEVKGPNVFAGYWRMPEKTAEEFRADGFFITGDLGVMDDEGRVSIVGRAKDLVISGGFNVYPKEVESAIDAIDGVAESAVIGVPHADFGEGVVALVVLEPGAALDEATVFAALRDQLAKFKQPKRVLFIEALPRNTMGKVQKAALRAEYAGLFAR